MKLSNLVVKAAVLILAASTLNAQEELAYDDGRETSFVDRLGEVLATRMSPKGPCKVIGLKFKLKHRTNEGVFVASLHDWKGDEPGDAVYEEPSVAVDGWHTVNVVGDWFFDGDFVVGFITVEQGAQIGIDRDDVNGRTWVLNPDLGDWDREDEVFLLRCIVEYTSTGVVEELGSTKTRVFPNPANAFISVETAESAQKVTVINSIGQAVYVSTNIENGYVSVDATGLPSGVYLIRVDSGKEFVTRRVIVR